MSIGPEGLGSIERPPTIKEQALANIRRQILSQKRKPGSLISAKGLAEELKISRTPVREAMESLARDGLIRWVGVAGAQIRTVDREEFFDILTLRHAIEPEVGMKLGRILDPEKERALDMLLREMKDALSGAKAAKGGDQLETFYDLDVKFHRTLARLARMDRAEAFIGNLMDHFRLFALEGMRSPKEILDDHKKIVKAIKGGKPEQIREAYTDHLIETVKRRAPSLSREAEERWRPRGPRG